MKVYTLGTGHGDSTVSRYNTSTAYETDDGRLYLFDVGAPAEASLRRRGLSVFDLRAVFLTHMHDDHVGGLTGLCKQITKYTGTADPERVIPIYFPEERAIEPFRAWFRAVRENPDTGHFSYRAVQDGVIYSDDHLTVTAIRTCHLRTISRSEGDPCSFAYVLDFKKEGKRVLHTGDLCGDFSDFPKIAHEEPFDLCVCEATHYSPEEHSGTLCTARFKRLVFIHVSDAWHVVVSPGWSVYNGEKKLLSLCRGFPYPVQVAHDGDEFLI